MIMVVSVVLGTVALIRLPLAFMPEVEQARELATRLVETAREDLALVRPSVPVVISRYQLVA